MPPGLALRLLPDGSLTLAAPNQPSLHYLQVSANGFVQEVLPRLVPGELPAPRSHRTRPPNPGLTAAAGLATIW